MALVIVPFKGSEGLTLTCSTMTLGILTLISANSCCKVCGCTAMSGITSTESIITESNKTDSIKSSRLEGLDALAVLDGKLTATSPLQACQ